MGEQAFTPRELGAIIPLGKALPLQKAGVIYDPGHFDWHLCQIPGGAQRKLSFSLQLTDPADYDGCELELHGGAKSLVAPRMRGAIITFPSSAMHRVTPIRRGIRRAVVIWTAGPSFR